MKFVPNILKAFLINLCFIGIIFASESCPSISPKMANDSPLFQVDAIINDVICTFIDLHDKDNSTFSSTLNITKKKIIPFIDLNYATELALGDYWNQLDSREKKIFERDLKNSLINDYVSILADMKNWEDISIDVDESFTNNGKMAEVKVRVSINNLSSDTLVTLKLIHNNRWRIYDLVYQSISILDIERIGYDSKIKRLGIKNLSKKLISKS